MKVVSRPAVISRRENSLGGVEVIEGVEYINEKTGKSLGILGHSFGLYGVSTGWFERCKTLQPLNECGVTIVDGRPVRPYE